MRNPDVHIHVCDAERARRAGEADAAYALYCEAGACAEQYGLWKTAVRCYRMAVEVDLFARAAVQRLAFLAPRTGLGVEWGEYAAALGGSWPRVTCRGVQVVIGAGAGVDCPKIGRVLELVMASDDQVDVTPDARFADIPVAMALMILRRALWPVAREDSAQPSSVRVVYRTRVRFRLFETADWSRQ